MKPLPALLDGRELLNAACELEGHPDNIAAAVLGGLPSVAKLQANCG